MYMSQVNEVRKLVLYKDGSHISVYEVSDYFDRSMLRLSEEVEVSFPLLPEDVRISSEVEKINQEVEELKARTIERIEILEQRKQELLALGFDGENK